MSGAPWWAFEVIQEGGLMDGMNIFTVRIFKLFGKRGLVVNDMLPVETPVGDFIGYHNRKGGHGLNKYDWEQFLAFADRHFGIAENQLRLSK
jgi:hypothetical protein